MRTNTACTIYNRHECDGVVRFNRTVLRAVHMEPLQGMRFQTAGAAQLGSGLVCIPFAVVAESKRFIDAKAYAALKANETKNYWTLADGSDYIVKGIVPAFAEPEPPAQAPTDEERMKALKKEQAFMYKIVEVKTQAFGARSMQHWEVIGR